VASNDYHFITHWHVRGAPREVCEILADAADLARWWPAVYLDVAVLELGGERGVGKVVELYTKGWLPYTLRWRFRVTKSYPPKGFEVEAKGDFVGRGIWTLAPDDDHCHVIYDWKIRANKPLLRTFSFLLKPIFAANHRWAMRMGEESLRLELARRHAATPADRARIPPPPQPTTTSPLALLAGTLALGVVLIMAARRLRKR